MSIGGAGPPWPHLGAGSGFSHLLHWQDERLKIRQSVLNKIATALLRFCADCSVFVLTGSSFCAWTYTGRLKEKFLFMLLPPLFPIPNKKRVFC